jgi:hypothetical protein
MIADPYYLLDIIKSINYISGQDMLKNIIDNFKHFTKISAIHKDYIYDIKKIGKFYIFSTYYNNSTKTLRHISMHDFTNNTIILCYSDELIENIDQYIKTTLDREIIFTKYNVHRL